MLTANRRAVMPGVHLTTIRTKKFKTGVFSVHMMLPLRRETASLNAVLPKVLERGTARYPSMQQISQALERLYGASVSASLQKQGEVQCVGFWGRCIDDRLAPGGEPLLQELTALMGDLLLRPATRNGRFYGSYVEGEQENLIRQIRAVKNDKRTYAIHRMLYHMCQDEAYGVYKLGSVETALAITKNKLQEHYGQILMAAPIEVFYCGSAPEDQAEAVLLQSLQGLPRQKKLTAGETVVLREPTAARPRQILEEMDIAQGRIVIGCRTGVTVGDPDFPAMLLFNAALGGTVSSKLFANVREKRSLCYDVGSMLDQNKGILLITAGIAPEQYDAAMEEIETQLSEAQQGRFTEQELSMARQMLVSSLRGISDSQSRLASFYLGQASTGQTVGPEELAQQVAQVTPEDLQAVGSKIRIDTVYFLKGTEG